MFKVRRALVSVSDKRNLIPFAQGLQRLGIEILSTGGTWRQLGEAGIDAVEVSVGHYESGFPMTAGRFDGFSGQTESSSLSARKRPLQTLQSTIGSLNPETWPETSHTRGFWMMAESSPTTFARAVTVRQLLRHESGIPRYVFNREFMRLLSEAPERVWKPAELLAYVFDDEPMAVDAAVHVVDHARDRRPDRLLDPGAVRVRRHRNDIAVGAPAVTKSWAEVG